MANLREIKTRIKSVKSTQQITKAMQMVAAAKVRRAQERLMAARPYSDKLEESIRAVGAALKGEDVKDPLLAARPVKSVGILVLTSDKGLAGSYNANVLKAAVALAREYRQQGIEPKLWLVGNKAVNFFKHANFHVFTTYSQLPAIPTWTEASMIADSLMAEFRAARIDRVEMIYTRFISMLSYKPTQIQLLPAEPPQADGNKPVVNYLFEPDAQTVLSAVLPQYVTTQVYRGLLEAGASELAARMTAMSSATRNAGDMLASMTLEYNKARQAAITKEILEVVGGAEALNG